MRDKNTECEIFESFFSEAVKYQLRGYSINEMSISKLGHSIKFDMNSVFLSVEFIYFVFVKQIVWI